MNRREEIKEEIVAGYLGEEMTYRELSKMYGYSLGTIHSWVNEEGRKKPGKGIPEGEEPEEEIRRLRAELRRSELHNKVLSKMIEIAESDLGVDIRKKRGPRQ